jgi:hypothetical protein
VRVRTGFEIARRRAASCLLTDPRLSKTHNWGGRYTHRLFLIGSRRYIDFFGNRQSVFWPLQAGEVARLRYFATGTAGWGLGVGWQFFLRCWKGRFSASPSCPSEALEKIAQPVRGGRHTYYCLLPHWDAACADTEHRQQTEPGPAASSRELNSQPAHSSYFLDALPPPQA